MATKAERRANRKAKRGKRISKLEELIQVAQQTPDIPDEFSDSDFAEKFVKYWPLLKTGLEFAEDSWITGKKTDALIEDVITIGDNIAHKEISDAEKQDFIEKLQKAWRIISRVLYVATVFTNDKTDEVLEKIIDIGNWITGEDD